MLRALELVDVGPAPRLRIDLGPRLNVLAGDNGLGKSFVLDVLWWALTGTWAGLPAWPRPGEGPAPEIVIELDREAAESLGSALQKSDVEVTDDTVRFSSRFDFTLQEWSNLPLFSSTNPLPALILYARADGGFAAWDPARNHYKLRPGGKLDLFDTEFAENPALLRRPPAYLFREKDLWDGLEAGGKTLCNGLIRDWVSWQRQHTDEIDQLSRTLEALSPNPERAETLRPGPPVRVFIDDTRDFPTVDAGYGPVPVIHASAGMRRVLSLAYLIIWTWREHLAASRLLRRPPVERLVLLMDEVENHLHPAWQRRLLPALLAVLEGLAPEMQVQAHLTTHAPLVLASLEPLFDEARDRFFVFDLEGGQVTLTELPWAKQGDAVDWLVSPAFKLEQGRSLEAERAIEDAEAFMRGDEPVLFKTREAIEAELRRVLGADDTFWPRWIAADEGAAP